MAESVISVSAIKGKFEVSCPFNMVGHIRDLPGKRWSAKKKSYVIPFSRKAAEMMSHISAPIVFDSPAIELMATAARPTPKQEPFPHWYRFKTTPMPHQQKALNFLWGKDVGGLWMEMRTGKSKVALDYACALKMAGLIDHILVFCPLSVRGSWEGQAIEHAPIDITVARFDLTIAAGKKSQVKFSQDAAEMKMMIVGIESMSAGSALDYVYDYIKGNGRVFCVCDEGHYIKNPKATRTEKITQLGAACSHRLILTGTPIASNFLDLYSQMKFLDEDIIGSGDFYSYKARVAVMGGYEQKQIISWQNVDEVMADIQPHVFQVVAAEVADLPPKIYQVREVTLPPNVESLYKTIKKRSIISFKGRDLVLSTPLDRLLRLFQLANGVMATGEGGEYQYEWVNDSKVNELMALIESAPTLPMVIWTTGRIELAQVVSRLEASGLKCVEMHGGINENDRIANVAAFQSGEVNYFVSNTAVGGTGIKLSRARCLVYMSSSFKYVDRIQSEARATDFLNIGESTLIVDIIAKGTVDELVLEALQAKSDVATYVKDKIKSLGLSEGLK